MAGSKLFLSFLSIFVISFIAGGESSITPAPEKGINVCAFDKTKTKFVLRRNITTFRMRKSKNCGIPGYADLLCTEVSYETKVYWYPFRRDFHYISFHCCPGWRGYQDGVGCLEEIPCEVQISQNSRPHCKTKRVDDLKKVQQIYKLGEKEGFPFALSDIDAMTLFNLYRNDSFTKTWMKMYIHMLQKNRKLIESFPLTHKKEFNSIKDYEEVYHFFINQMKNTSKLFRFPFDTLPFKSVVNSNTWKEDRVFAELRLAGLNPMCIQKVSLHQGQGVTWSSLSRRLNMNTHWEHVIQRAFGRTLPLQMIISDGSVFVCHFPLFDNIVNVPDITEGNPSRKMWKSMSPIAVFVSRPSADGQTAELVPAAIQMDSKPESPVLTPEDGDLWLLAKESFHVTDFAYVEMVEHLLKTHLMMEPFCTTIHRHLSYLHPIHQIMKFHCRGLLPTNKIGFPKLVDDKAYMHQLFAIGNVGSVQLLVKAFHTMSWADTDFQANIKMRGLDDKRKLPYFPYRDDGSVLYRSIQSFVQEYVEQYYGNDADVKKDNELQALANEMSVDGKGEDGGKGKLRGFPSRISSISLLTNIITRLIWTSSAQHTAVNYPIAAYGAFTPMMPSKIYDDPRVPDDTFDLYRLPNGNISAIQAGVAMSLGSLHLDDLLDYGAQLSDQERGGQIVQKHFKRLNNLVKPLLDQRNERRFQGGHLTYPFLTPGWVPNSICT
ncbi:arachidonate 5-lipoxygenase-like [Actinia tenebrosa]|uniref:Arachidonate 5-lipoxygenase-like n=1 Tax=Actinia tenebrosa TaxID=6105 RepID=A0A6P8HC27_ACTTE|nr:arachidonate 5-lipoxygenase-like [Actinia tenebrosa]